MVRWDSFETSLCRTLHFFQRLDKLLNHFSNTRTFYEFRDEGQQLFSTGIHFL